ncbi:hypothetical protein ACHWQZ_G014932 [Mnemiopsis leidyi]
MKKMAFLMTVILLMQSVTVKSTSDRDHNILKFGHTENDYVMFAHDMSMFTTGFTVCSWVRKLRNDQVPTWFSYAVSGENREIQISDMGDRTRIFGDYTNLASLYTVTPGTWFHNCLSWDSATSTRDVYIDGVRVDSKATPAGRTLRQGGTIVLGNEQDSGPGAGMDIVNIFDGELYKLNMFTRKLNDSEIRELSVDMCSEVEMKYGNERGLKWEDVLQKTKYGNVVEKDGGSGCMQTVNDMKMEYEASLKELNNTILQLTSELNGTIVEGKNAVLKLNNTMQKAIVQLKNMDKELSSKTQGEILSLKERSQETTERQETIQMISWVLVATSIMNTLIILVFTVYKLWIYKRKSNYAVKMNDNRSPNSPAENSETPNEYITKDEIYENLELDTYCADSGTK